MRLAVGTKNLCAKEGEFIAVLPNQQDYSDAVLARILTIYYGNVLVRREARKLTEIIYSNIKFYHIYTKMNLSQYMYIRRQICNDCFLLHTSYEK